MSAIATFKAALLARLAADATLVSEQVQVSWGNPYPKAGHRELVFLGAATAGETEPVGLGYTVGVTDREERFAQEVIVSVVGPPEETQQTLETRALAIAETAQASIIAWAQGATPFGNTLGGGWAIPGGITTTEALEIQTDEGGNEYVVGREASVRFLIDVVARLSS